MLSQGGVQGDYAAQWAKYYRSQGMNREAMLIEDYVKNRGRSAGQAGGQAPGYGTSECYRCNRFHHLQHRGHQPP